MNNFLSSFPDQKTLLELYPKLGILQVNAHLHTPYSFSAFTDIRQMFEMAQKENIAVLGINDFFVTDGYDSFYREALNYGIFPLFNIEFISLMNKEQKDGIRINDPNNPGRCYFSGKGLDFPYSLTDPLRTKLEKVVTESQDQVRAMIDKANKWFVWIDTNIRLSYDDIRKKYAKELVRERHVAKAIRMAVFDQSASETDRIVWFTKIFDGKAPKSEVNDIPGLENEIRGNLLKAGGKAFVEEDDNAFMSLEEVIEIITNAGGIPCYPVLLDDRNGNYTEYEKDPEFLRQELRKKQVGCIELIPGRNDATHLEKFVNFFHDKGFVILLGTEHNAPDMIPITCDTRGRKPLSTEMQRISYEGSCVVVAHQYLRSKDLTGFLNVQGIPQTAERDSFVKLGNAIIHHFVKSFKRDQ